MMDVWAVTWRYLGQNHLVDFDREAEAHDFALLVEEAGSRKEVLVTKHALDIDPAIQERIWKRIQERLTTPDIPMVMKEAAG